MSFESYFERTARKAHAYPPPDMFRPVSLDKVVEAWSRFAAQSAGRPLGIYAHVPFCERKCSFCYCDTIITKKQDQVDAYLSALKAEAALFAGALKGVPVDTLYLGGGTPTWIGADRLDDLLGTLKELYTFDANIHVNIESTPGSLTEDVARVLKKYGTNRVTIGVQALDEQLLAAVNRPQTLEQVGEAIARLRAADVAVVNLDLVGGLSGDTEASFRKGFEQLLSYGPDMVHVYPYTEQRGDAPNPEKRAIIAASEEMLRNAGFAPQRHDAWGKGPHTRNQQVVDKVEHGGSCLGLGLRARSHIFNQLAYRSHFKQDYVRALTEAKAPAYYGWPVTKRIQVQKYLMDNLQGGVQRRFFAECFGFAPEAYLQAKHPSLMPHLSVERDEVRLTGSFQHGHDHSVELFDDKLKEALYGHYAKMPAAWPKEAATTPLALDDDRFDENFMHFLAIQLSKGNTYPPLKEADAVPEARVQEAWASFNDEIRRRGHSPSAGIYVHVPYCASICKFCYCFKHLLEKQEVVENYVQAVIAQVRRMAPHTTHVRFNSIYMGGGTPSVLSSEQLRRLVGALRESFQFTDDHQFNFEGTPATLARHDRLETLGELGVTRLTVGIQSLERDLLSDMNRAQQGKSKVKEVIDRARAAGVSHINTDLMVGLPGQSFDDFKTTFDLLASWQPDVVHVYPFQPTPETTYFREGFRVTSDIERLREKMLRYANEQFPTWGYKQVLLESWALSEEARNRQDAEKILSAASILPLGYLARGHVFGRLSYGSLEKEYKAYIDDHSKVDVYTGNILDIEDDMVRYMISNLMMGIDRVRFHDLFGEDPLKRFWHPFRWLQRQGLVDVQRTKIVSKMRNSAESVVYAKALFHEKYMVELRSKFADTYDASTDWKARWREMYAQSF